jgi:DNA repair photolyase
MRWSNLSAPPDSAAAPPLPLALPGATVRTFDTPGFAGMTFYEIQAKSIINRVPGASRVPFEWTVNPYRGCSHACSYCLSGDTPILMADGTQRPLAQLRPGDTVYGTAGTGPHRRYVPTTVLDHWTTRKPGWRVTLADGTTLVASGDHRFLTDHGWRHVSPGGDRPHLRTGDRLHGIGHLADPPKDTSDYRSGFLYGLVRGDAALTRRRPLPLPAAAPARNEAARAFPPRPRTPVPAGRPWACPPAPGPAATRPGAQLPDASAGPTWPGLRQSSAGTGIPGAARREPGGPGASRPSAHLPSASAGPTWPGPTDVGSGPARLSAPGSGGRSGTWEAGGDVGLGPERRASVRGAAWERADEYLRDVSLPRALQWPAAPSDGWLRGFVAGLFGAAGEVDGLVARLTGQSRELLVTAVAALTRLGVPARLAAATAAVDGMHTVEIGGTLRDTLRLFHLTGITGPAAPTAAGLPVSADDGLRVTAVEPLGLDLPLYDITTGTGDFIADGVVSHNCFARNTHTYLDLDAGHDFDSKVVVKVNAADLVRRELAAPRWSGAPIAMGTNVDCYQRAEGKYRLMPGIIAALRDFANPFSILTKGTLILRDLPLLRQAAQVTAVGISMSVGFVDEAHWRAVEPGTPSPRRRLDAVRALTDAGFTVGVLMAPILPGLTDTAESIDETVAAIAAAGAASVSGLPLHLRPGAREWYAAWLARTHPHLVPRYRELYGTGSYLPQGYQREVTARVRLAARRYGLHRADLVENRASPGTPAPPAEQLTLL